MTNVEVSLVVAGKFGPFVHEAEIVTDLPSDPKFVIRTSATAHPAFRVEELTNASNSVLSGRRGLQRVEYEVLAIGTPADPPANLNQLDISSTVDVEWVGVQEQVPCDDGLRVASRRLGVLLDRSGRPEQRRAEIIFRSGDQTLYRQGLRWEVKPSITVSPKVVVMHSDNRKYRALIHASDNAQFRIKRIECDVAGVRVRALGASAAISQTIELGGLPQSRKSQGVAIVFTDHPLQEKVELPFVVIEE